MPLRARKYMGRWVTGSPSRRTWPFIRTDEADGDVERRGLACSIGTEQANNFALLNAHADLIHDPRRPL